jgi:hypothetical protein
MNLPGSFKYSNKNGENIRIEYSIECFVDKFKDVLCHKKVFEIREYYFTQEEIKEEQEKIEKIRNLRQILK